MSMQLKVAKGRALGRQGDPGLFDFIGKGIKGLAQAWLPNVFGSKVLTGTPPFASPALLPAPGKQVIRRGSGPTFTPLMPSIPDVIQQWTNQPGGKGGMASWGGSGNWPTNKDGTPRRARRDGRPFKRPSMNFANGRAIKRSARRLEGAEKLFRRVFSIRHGAVHGKILPKRGK